MSRRRVGGRGTTRRTSRRGRRGRGRRRDRFWRRPRRGEPRGGRRRAPWRARRVSNARRRRDARDRARRRVCGTRGARGARPPRRVRRCARDAEALASARASVARLVNAADVPDSVAIVVVAGRAGGDADADATRDARRSARAENDTSHGEDDAAGGAARDDASPSAMPTARPAVLGRREPRHRTTVTHTRRGRRYGGFHPRIQESRRIEYSPATEMIPAKGRHAACEKSTKVKFPWNQNSSSLQASVGGDRSPPCDRSRGSKDSVDLAPDPDRLEGALHPSLLASLLENFTLSPGRCCCGRLL